MKLPLITCAVLLAAGCKARLSQAGLKDAGAGDAPAAEDLATYTCPAGAEPIKVAFFDADSTLRVSKSGAVSANTADDVNLLPLVARKVAQVNAEGFLVAIVSNQGGVAAGYVTFEQAVGGLQRIASLLAQRAGARVDYLGLAPGDGELRKPKTGMADKLDKLLTEKCGRGIDKAASFMVGDSGYTKLKDGPHPDGRPADDFSNSDRLFAENLLGPGHFHEPTDYFGWKAWRVYNIETEGELDDFLVNLENNGSEAEKEEARAVRKLNGLVKPFRFVHFNVKELTTGKLVDQNDAQIKRASETIRELNPDILSINEIQYDLPDVPTKGLPGTGENMKRLMGRIGIPDGAAWTFNLAPANTGALAKKKPDGNYATDPNGPGAKELQDTENFGTFPGQYSTGFATRFPPAGPPVVLTDVLWKDFDPAVAIPGAKLLFDKNFNDVVVDIGGKPAHLVTFHAVPAFGFGGDATFNVARNAAQLEFLAWYLLGACDPAANGKVKRCETDVKPLGGAEAFIAVGDFNVDWNAASAGAAVLKKVLADERVNNWRAVNYDYKMTADASDKFKLSRTSYMSDGVDLGKLQSELDYFLVSKHFKIRHGRVYAPFSDYAEISCHPQKAAAEAARASAPDDGGKHVVSVSTRYAEDGTRTYCVVSVSGEFAAFRKGSDHFPMYLTFAWAK